MKRREFAILSSSTLLGASSLNQSEAASHSSTASSVKMYVGCQKGPTNPEMLQFFKRHGVNNICGHPPKPPRERGHWTVEDLKQTREMCEKHGVTLDMVALPFLASSHIDRERRGAIMLGKSPERDKDIEDIQKMIAGCAEAGIPAFKYNMSLLGVLRTESTPGRGGVRYSTWDLSKAKADPELTRAGRVNAEEAWERITYFLDRVIPVCNEYKIRACCHPHDPGVPPEGFQGIYRVLGTVDGLKKFASIQESPYHGFNLCLGTTAEMLQDPATEIHDVIEYFGRRKKIFNIHYRNIVGKRDKFYEVFPDNGDMDMLQVALSLQKVGYPYMVMPDHMPRHDDDRGGKQAFAFAYGYINATLKAVEAMT